MAGEGLGGRGPTHPQAQHSAGIYREQGSSPSILALLGAQALGAPLR